MSEYVSREPCPACGSRDNLARYSDGHAWCFGSGCGHYEPATDAKPRQRRSMDEFSPVAGRAQALTARRLTEETCRRWDYVCSTSGEPCQVANYRDPAGNLVGQKLRFADKRFAVRGQIGGQLYGRHLWREGGRRVIVTEGEIDALSVSQVLEHRWQVVSLPNGAQSARKALAANLEWLLSFEAVVLCFDMDDAGRGAVDECVKLFPPGRVRIVQLPMKDPNEMLVAGRIEELVRCLWDAREYRPDGIRRVSELRDRVLRPVEHGLPWFLPSLTEATYGRRLGEAHALGAGVGMGKSTFLTQQIAEDLASGHSVGAFFFEQLPDETIKRVAGQAAGRTFWVPDSGWTQAELAQEVGRLADADRLFLYDHFGACSWELVKERIRYLYHAHGVRLFYLDHLTALAAAVDDERRGLELIMAEMGLLVKELNIWLLFVSHLATPEGKSHEEGGRVMAKHFKGSRAIMQWAHFMYGLERDTQADDATTRGLTRLRILKDRFTGLSLGKTFSLGYDAKTGRLEEISEFGRGATPTEEPF